MKEVELFKKDIQQLKLTSSEMERIHLALQTQHAPTQRVPSPIKAFHMIPIGAFALLLLLGTPLIHASNNSLPGDILYPFKINVVEKVQGITVDTPEEETLYYTELTHKRLAEAAALIKKGEANRKILGSVERRINSEAQKALTAANRTEQSQNVAQVLDLKTEVKNTFQAHSQVFATIYEDTQDPSAREFAETLGDKIRVADDEIKESVQEIYDLDPLKKNDIVGAYIQEVNKNVEHIIREVAKDPTNIDQEHLKEIVEIEDRLLEVDGLIQSNNHVEAINILADIQERIELPKKVEKIQEDVEELSDERKENSKTDEVSHEEDISVSSEIVKDIEEEVSPEILYRQ